jgi:UDP-glucose 4-epimerase
LCNDFGYTPRYTTIEAFDDYVTGSGLTRILDPQRVEALGGVVRGLLGRGSLSNA